MTATLESIADQIRGGQFEEAERGLDTSAATDENRAQLTFLRGFLQESLHDRAGALATYQEAMELDPTHREAMFRAALMADAYGDDQTAIELYERCADGEEAHVHALINLAVLYEEHRRLGDAERCLRHVLTELPNHGRARRFLRSVESSYTMVYDERQQREQEQRNAVLDIPVTDFELSVRSRNCLRQMDIATLGDLLRTTEAELLSYKNFGETSLNEIKAMLSQKGLRLGQELHTEPVLAARPAEPSADAAVAMNVPVGNLELSVRSRKCLQRLGISTLGELTQHTEAELTATKNFGQTSLNEIKRQLLAYGLTFRIVG